MKSTHITIKEFVSVILATAASVKNWVGKMVLAHCDNRVVVAILNFKLEEMQRVGMFFNSCIQPDPKSSSLQDLAPEAWELTVG